MKRRDAGRELLLCLQKLAKRIATLGSRPPKPGLPRSAQKCLGLGKMTQPEARRRPSDAVRKSTSPSGIRQVSPRRHGSCRWRRQHRPQLAGKAPSPVSRAKDPVKEGTRTGVMAQVDKCPCCRCIRRSRSCTPALRSSPFAKGPMTT